MRQCVCNAGKESVYIPYDIVRLTARVQVYISLCTES